MIAYLASKCPACGEARTYVLCEVGAGRTRRSIPMRSCDSCGTMNCAAGYAENDSQLQADTAYNVNLMERKRPMWKTLCDLLLANGGKPPCADVGCATGGFIESLQQHIGPSIGYDLNPFAIQTGLEMFPDLVLKNAPFGDDGERFNIITSVDTFEHIADPDPLMERIVNALNSGGLFYLYVPRINELHVEQLMREMPEDQMTFSAFYSPFRDLDVHVTHYTSAGLAALGTRFGLTVIKDYVGGEWPINGVLFEKP